MRVINAADRKGAPPPSPQGNHASSCPFALCDVDLDGAITVADALLVLRAAVDLPAELCDVSTVRFSDTTTSTTVSSTTTSTRLHCFTSDSRFDFQKLSLKKLVIPAFKQTSSAAF